MIGPLNSPSTGIDFLLDGGVTAHQEIAKYLGIQSVWDYDGTDLFGLSDLSVSGTPTTAAAIIAAGGNAMDLDVATPDYLTLADASCVHERFKSAQWTFGCFFEQDAAGLGGPAGQGLVSKWRATNGYRSAYLRINASDQIECSVSETGDLGGGEVITDSVAVLANDVWYAGFGFDGQVTSLYVGEVGVDSAVRHVGSVDATFPIFDAIDDFAVGAWSITSSPAGFDGRIQYPFRANRCWGPAEHNLFYNGGLGLRLQS